MKPPKAFHPPLFAAYPILSLYAANVSLIPWEEVLIPLAAVVGVCSLLWLLVALVLRDAARAATSMAVVTAGLFSYGLIATIADERGSLISPKSWLVMIVIAAAAAGWKAKWNRGATTFLNVAGLALSGFALISIARSHWAIGRELAAAAKHTGEISTGEVAKVRPDIFYIVLDGYGRTDTFEKEYGFTDRNFVENLEENGFFVAKRATTNYVQTELSLASSLNLNYLDQFMKRFGNPSEERAFLDHKIDESEVSRYLRRLGYRYFAITTGFPALRFKSADVAIEQESGGSLFVNALRDLTPFPTAESGYESQYAVRRKYIEGGYRALENLARPGTAPKFVVLHVLAPHPPFVYGPRGEPRLPKGPFGFWDGSHFHDLYAGRNDYVSGYRDQAKYIADRTLKAVERLLEAPRPPVIIIQGDHGPKNELNQDDLRKSNLPEVFGILSAMHVPESVRSDLAHEITPVNTFRVLFSKLFGSDVARLPDRNYFSPWGAPLDFVDVTDQIGLREPASEEIPDDPQIPTNSAGTSNPS